MISIASIEDRLAIRELQDRYADAVFRCDEQAYAASWTDDAHWEIVDNKVDGVENIVRLWKQFMIDLETVIMYATAGKIELDGNNGTGRWYVLDINRSKDGKDVLINSLYDDVYQKDGHGNWRFKSRKLQILMASELRSVNLFES